MKFSLKIKIDLLEVLINMFVLLNPRSIYIHRTKPIIPSATRKLERLPLVKVFVGLK